MKRIIKIGLAGVLLTSVFTAGVYAATVAPKVFVHGNAIQVLHRKLLMGLSTCRYAQYQMVLGQILNGITKAKQCTSIPLQILMENQIVCPMLMNVIWHVQLDHGLR